MSDALPDGIVTFLFTDVEGSTKLLEQLGPERYGELLVRHRQVVRSELRAHGGVEVDTQGDAFFCAFASATAAVTCAAAVQRGLGDGDLRLRMGIHSGEALIVDRHYIGMDVHRAARIGACGHGGQVVISPTTVALLESGDFPLRELGAHRLKDLAAPVTLYQLGDDEFPPLAALFATNLPVPATGFLGRREEVESLVARCSDPGVRLVTLTGPGGTGKTRLSLQVAAELSASFPGGVWWVSLAPLRDGALVVSTVADVLAVEEEPDRAPTDAITDALQSKRVLLLLDNCEHVLDDAADLVGAVLRSCPGVLVLATSREPLAVSGEHVVAVEPLESTDAVALFDARARAAGASPEALVETDSIRTLCERLDNLPLAVELAAARTSTLPPAELLKRLSARLDVLKGPRDADERQRTLRATIAWSYDLLEEHEQRVFAAVSVFAGGASLEAVETVCEAELDDLLSLVEKSLVRHAVVDGGEPWYWMLETIREFAVERLGESAVGEAARERHAAWYAALARAARAQLVGPGSNEVLARLERDRENLRAALARCTAAEGRSDDAVALSIVLCAIHSLHGRYAESETVARLALELDPRLLDIATLQAALSVSLRRQSRGREGLDSLLGAERTLDRIGSRDAEWWSTWIDVRLAQANHFYFEADLDALARAIAELRPVVEERGSAVQRLELMHVLAQDAYRKERYVLSDETEQLVREIYRRSLELEDDYAEFVLGFCLLWRSKFEEAERYLLHALESARLRGDVLVEVRCLVYAVVARRRMGDTEAARELLLELDAIDDLQRYRGLTRACGAWVALRDGDLEKTSDLAGAALDDWAAERGRGGPTVFQWTARFPLLAVAVGQGHVDVALAHARAMLDPVQQPLPDEIAAALAGGEQSMSVALELARPGGYV